MNQQITVETGQMIATSFGNWQKFGIDGIEPEDYEPDYEIPTIDYERFENYVHEESEKGTQRTTAEVPF